MKFAVALLITAFASLTVWGQAPTLHIVTEIPNLPSELYYGTEKIKPLRLRPGTNTPITLNNTNSSLLNDSDFFVNQQYVDFLNRFPDQSGFNYWVNQITSCNGNLACIRGQRYNTSGAFFLSIEFQETGYLAERMYKVAYGEFQGQSTLGGNAHQIMVPIIRRGEFLPDALQLSNGVIIGQPNAVQQLEANKVAYSNDFVNRSRFTTAYPGSMSAAQFVDALNINSGNALDSAQRNNLVNQLGAGTMTRGQVVRAVAEDSDLVNAEKNKAFVLMQYLGYLRRDPNAGPDNGDYKGYEFWLQKLNDHGGDFHAAQMVESFVVSGEYEGRFQ